MAISHNAIRSLLEHSQIHQTGKDCPPITRVRKKWGYAKKLVQEGRRAEDARSVHEVREHGNGPTCLREAATAMAGNAVGECFNVPHDRNWNEASR